MTLPLDAFQIFFNLPQNIIATVNVFILFASIDYIVLETLIILNAIYHFLGEKTQILYFFYVNFNCDSTIKMARVAFV